MKIIEEGLCVLSAEEQDLIMGGGCSINLCGAQACGSNSCIVLICGGNACGANVVGICPAYLSPLSAEPPITAAKDLQFVSADSVEKVKIELSESHDF